MLHSVGNAHINWIYNFLSVRLIHIENLFSYLNKNKIKTYFVKDLYDYDFNVPEKGVALTFDDGYLDNWVFLFPLMEKYNIKATFFVNPEFVDNRDIIREKLSNEVNEDEKEKALGFLSWQEMIEMEKSGLADIQSHSMSHTWYYSTPELIDFYSPSVEHKKKYPWISWNEKPELKSFTHNASAYKSLKYGLPVFKHDRSLQMRKFYPDENIIEEMVNFASDNPEIFKANGINTMQEKFTKLTSGRKEIGKFETDSELRERYWYELKESKNILEKKLNKEITLLCWPGGAYNETSLKLSEECGYIASTVWSQDKNPVDNRNKKYKRIVRAAMSGNISARGKSFGPSFLKKFLIHEYYPVPFFSNTLIKAEKILHLITHK
jgi:peptidoglycan/xylan/chitin deacetylase (PgdA/CDA1 family)